MRPYFIVYNIVYIMGIISDKVNVLELWWVYIKK